MNCSATLSVTSTVTPDISIAATPGNIICSGTNVTFSATPVNGGTTPSYQWLLNGSNVGSNADTYLNSSLNNGDVIACTYTSNASCISAATANSNTITINVTTSVTPSVTIIATTGNSNCSGVSVTFSATPTNGGATPSYQWSVNGSPVVGINSDTYSNNTLTDQDV